MPDPSNKSSLSGNELFVAGVKIGRLDSDFDLFLGGVGAVVVDVVDLRRVRDGVDRVEGFGVDA